MCGNLTEIKQFLMSVNNINNVKTLIKFIKEEHEKSSSKFKFVKLPLIYNGKNSFCYELYNLAILDAVETKKK